MIPVRLLEERIDIAIIFTDVVVHLPNMGFRESAAGDEGFESRGLLLSLAPLTYSKPINAYILVTDALFGFNYLKSLSQ